MCQVEILGKEKLNGFIQKRWINGKVGFLNKKKQSQDTQEIKSEKKSQRIKLF